MPKRKDQTAPENEYTRAAAVWDGRHGGLVTQLGTLRFIIFTLVFLLLLAILGNIVQITRSDVAVHVVEVTETGRVKTIVPLSEPPVKMARLERG